jgi:hypothetical protein
MTMSSHQRDSKVPRRPQSTINYLSNLLARSRGYGTQPVDVVLDDEETVWVDEFGEHVVVEG